MPADYNIPMTDAQITEALQLMVERVSEGWAQETYDGSPVGSGSPYYHKSSKWWATQAADAAARAEAAVPAGTAGAVFFDRAQSLTTAQQEQARRNIMAGGSNRNLLDNPWWGSAEVVNQRGVTSGTTIANGYNCIDRWKTNYGSAAGTFALTAGGIELTSGTNTYAAIQQKIDNPSKLYGKTLTASALLSDGTIIAGTQTFTGSQTITFITQNDIRLMLSNTGEFVLNVYGGPKTIRAVKLELGSVSTLANDAPPCYAEELAKCQRYFVRLSADTAYGMFGMGIVNNAGGTSAWVMLNLPVSMRRFPDTMTYGGSFRTLAGVNGALVTGTVSTMSISTNASNRNVARIDILGTGFGQFGTPFMLGANNDASAYIDLSADL